MRQNASIHTPLRLVRIYIFELVLKVFLKIDAFLHRRHGHGTSARNHFFLTIVLAFGRSYPRALNLKFSFPAMFSYLENKDDIILSTAPFIAFWRRRVQKLLKFPSLATSALTKKYSLCFGTGVGKTSFRKSVWLTQSLVFYFLRSSPLRNGWFISI